MQLITEGIQNCMEEKDEEKLAVFHQMLQMTEIREMATKEQEKDAFNKKIEDAWADLVQIDERKAKEFED
jgi:hypothetical protein